jgi:uncharacterized membrane protein
MKFLRVPLVVIVGLAVGVVGLLLKNTCATTGWGGSAYTYMNLCYSDIGPLYYLRGFADNLFPYFDNYQGQYLEYPVLTGLTMWLANMFLGIVSDTASGAGFVYSNWILNLVFISAAIAVISKIKSANRNAAWWFALSPALLLTLGINWDALAVLLAVTAVLMWQTNRVVYAGIAIGLGAAAKLFPALILIPIAIDVYRSRSWLSGFKTLVAAGGAWLAINLPFIIFAREGWFEFYRFSSIRGIDFGSPWLGLKYVFDVSVSTEMANIFGLGAVAITSTFLFFARKRIDFITGVFVVVAVFALFNKVYSPQFWIWLAPLAALTAIRLRHFIFWNLAQTIYFYSIWRFLLYMTDASIDGGVNSREYGLAIVLMWLSTAALVGFALAGSWKSSGALARTGELQTETAPTSRSSLAT